ncbi:unnamed protein product [Mytilus coruscus]|uniref:Uncharacterized protein n=1 Tax=Mytilus coruscus TaxID=42192 RepID=A0A6J8DWB3_MYTCO|nr:unnamed protein product [Mytilus coruscus]
MNNKPMPIVTNTSHIGIQRDTTDSAGSTIDENLKKARRSLYSLMYTGLHGENGLDSVTAISMPQVLELTDAGPGVGKSNRDVRFRAAEKILIDNLDFYTGIHKATGDRQNEVERTQVAVGKALSDGGSIYWEYKQLDVTNEAEKVDKIAHVEGHLSRQRAISVFKKSDNAPGQDEQSDIDDDVTADVPEDEVVIRQNDSDTEGSDQKIAGPPAALVIRFGRRTFN